MPYSKKLTPMTFRIEYILQNERRGMLIARQLVDGPIHLTEHARLGDVSIQTYFIKQRHPATDQPDSSGLYTFLPNTLDDLKLLSKAQLVELYP
ncbi:hypothetical protein [Chitinimonas naiadis]